MSIAPRHEACAVVGEGFDCVRLDRAKSAGAFVEEKRERPAAARADDEILQSIAVKIEPGDAGAGLAESEWQQGLAFLVIEGHLRVDVRQRCGRVFEQRRRWDHVCSLWLRWGATLRVRGFGDLEKSVGSDVVDGGDVAVAPLHAERHGGGRGSRGEGHRWIGAGLVAAAADYFCGLKWDGAARQGDFRADRLGVGGAADEADGDAVGRAVVVEDGGGSVEVVDDEVGKAIAIEVGEGEALVDASGIEAPRGGGLLERGVAVVSKGADGEVEFWIEPVVLHQFAGEGALSIGVGGGTGPGVLHGLDPGLGVVVLDVAEMAGPDEEVVVAVEVDVEEDGGPGPVGGGEVGEGGDFGIGAVAAGEEERIAHDLPAFVIEADGRGARHLGESLAFSHLRIPADHVDDDEVEMPVAVDVGEVDAH